MSAQTLNISYKTKHDETTFVSLHDFEITEGEPISASVVLDDPTTSLYCYDPAADRAIFVKTPDAIDLTKAPFFYQAQYEHATRLIAVPKAEFIRLGNLAPTPENPIIMIHSVGRCGSTLLSQVFDALPETVSFLNRIFFQLFTDARC